MIIFWFVFRMLEDRDPEYQLLAVRGLLGNAKRVLATAKDEAKIQAIQAGIQVLEEFLANFEANNMMQYQRAYLPLELVQKFPPPEDALQREFLECYGGERVNGNYKQLRSMFPKQSETQGDGQSNTTTTPSTPSTNTNTTAANVSWDVLRNRHIAQILEQMKTVSLGTTDSVSGDGSQNGGSVQWFEESNGTPTRQHLQLIHWAYSPKPEELQAYLAARSLKTAEKRSHETSERGLVEDKAADNGLTSDKKLKMS